MLHTRMVRLLSTVMPASSPITTPIGVSPDCTAPVIRAGTLRVTARPQSQTLPPATAALVLP